MGLGLDLRWHRPLTNEVLSRVRFMIDTKLTHFLVMLVLFAAGCAFMFRSYRDKSRKT